MGATQPKHAQGPWFSAAERQQGDLGESIEIYSDTQPPVQIATVLNADDFPCCADEDVERLDAEAQATARLIAAAPELLEACHKALEMRAMLSMASNALNTHSVRRKAAERADELVKQIRATIASTNGASQ